MFRPLRSKREGQRVMKGTNFLGSSAWRCMGALRVVALSAIMLGIGAGCSMFDSREQPPVGQIEDSDYTYLIGPGDSLSIFVWRNPDLSSSVTVRPDGKVSTPLVDDLRASGRTPTELARDVEEVLSEFIRDPLVTVSVGGFIGEYYEQVRILGEAVDPRSIPYRRSMTLLDVMIAVGGLTEFANGNAATLVRVMEDEQVEYRVRLEDLVKGGDITANRAVQPGDIIIIPEAFF